MFLAEPCYIWSFLQAASNLCKLICRYSLLGNLYLATDRGDNLLLVERLVDVLLLILVLENVLRKVCNP